MTDIKSDEHLRFTRDPEPEIRHSILATNFLSYKRNEPSMVGPTKRDGMTDKHIRAYSICHYYNDMNSCLY
jgi:hypothetical protein